MTTLDKVTGSGIPSNVQPSGEIIGLWIAVVFLACLVVALIIVLIVKCYRSDAADNKITTLRNLVSADITDEEKNIIVSYRKLNDRDKAMLRDTLNALYDNPKYPKE